MTQVDKKTFEESAPKAIKRLAEHVKSTAVKSYGIDAKVAEQLGIDVALNTSDEWAGVQVYIPASIDADIFGENAPEIIKDLAARAKATAIESYGLDDATAEQFGIDIALKVGDEWGGAQVYIPSNIALKISQRDMQMYKEFNGFNQAALAKKYHCSVVWVYQVVKRVRRQIQDKQQSQLPL